MLVHFNTGVDRNMESPKWKMKTEIEVAKVRCVVGLECPSQGRDFPARKKAWIMWGTALARHSAWLITPDEDPRFLHYVGHLTIQLSDLGVTCAGYRGENTTLITESQWPSSASHAPCTNLA